MIVRKDQLKHKKIFLNKSQIDGSGIFAKKNFKRGDCVTRIKGPIIKHIVTDHKTSAMGPNWVGFGKDSWIDSEFPIVGINHSCSPNVGIRGARTVVALKNIKKGEEILMDYSITEADLLWSLGKKCLCGSRNCRESIRSIQSLPLSIFRGYLPYIGRYFQKIYLRYNKNK